VCVERPALLVVSSYKVARQTDRSGMVGVTAAAAGNLGYCQGTLYRNTVLPLAS